MYKARHNWRLGTCQVYHQHCWQHHQALEHLGIKRQASQQGCHTQPQVWPRTFKCAQEAVGTCGEHKRQDSIWVIKAKHQCGYRREC